MNNISNSVLKILPVAFLRPETKPAASPSAVHSNFSSITSSSENSASAARIDNAPETQAFLMRIQELETSASGSTSPVAGSSGRNGRQDDLATFLDGFSSDTMRVTVSGTTAIVSFMDGSKPLMLNLALGSVTLTFADGTTAQIMAQTPSRLLEALHEANAEEALNLTNVA